MNTVHSNFFLVSKQPKAIAFVPAGLAGLDANKMPEEFIGIGNSMAPSLLPGDRVRIEKIKGNLRPGWIVVFSWQDKMFTHRVIRVGHDFFWARGDASAEQQGPVPAQQALGRVIAFYRDGTWHSQKGIRKELSGWLMNQALNAVRRVSRSSPSLRRTIETRILGGVLARRVFQRLGPRVLGEIRVKEVRDPERVFGAFVSELREPNSQNLDRIGAQLRRGALKLYVARSDRGMRLGQVILSLEDEDPQNPTGTIFSLLVRLGFRGMGVGRLLLEAVEHANREKPLKRLAARVDPSNVRSLGLFRSMGYEMKSLEGSHLKSDNLLILEKVLQHA